MGENKVFELGGVFKLSNGVSYAPRGMDSSYFYFIPTFGLNWDCLEAEFGMVFVPCYGMFCGFNTDSFGGRLCGST